jgi:hypothetical protein
MKPTLPMLLPVGTVLYGYCNGYFGRDSYESKRVETVGADWVVARSEYNGNPVFAYIPFPDPKMIEEWKTPEAS